MNKSWLEKNALWALDLSNFSNRLALFLKNIFYGLDETNPELKLILNVTII